ncbi:hypothetical protein F4778DRAFT_389997 [Xylariomycetidae sp. FL2044]|nr:hypothetical protein F4778DRAFT_389997 [Xylariomycetidae sp. FL2044]
MPLQLPHPTTTLHLYRHLLRESTYLPPLCRPWIASRIQGRFRDCLHVQNKESYIKQAHHDLRYLRSANAGHVERMLHLCFLATGRKGKRRRLLATSELRARPAESSDELDHQIRSITASGSLQDKRLHPDGTPRDPDWLDNWDVTKIKAIAASQVLKQAKNWPYTMRRLYDPLTALPTENCFGRPFHRKVARAKLKNHWAGVLAQLLPPLPRGEWDRLAVLAAGGPGADGWRMSPRRVVAQSSSSSTIELPSRSWDWKNFAVKPARQLERGSSRRMKSLTGREDDDPRGHGKATGVRTLSARRLRRSIYNRVWEASPILEPGKANSWRVRWGNLDEKLTNPSARNLRFFNGVDKNGKIVTAKA